MSSLFGTRWWVSLLIVLIVTGTAVMMFEAAPDAGLFASGLIGLFALYGFVSSVGWFGTFAVIGASSAGGYLLVAVGRERTATDRPPTGPVGRSGGSLLETTSDQTILRYAGEYLADGGERETKKVIAALRARLLKEDLRLRPGQDLSWIAGRALASSRAPATASGPPRVDADRTPDAARETSGSTGPITVTPNPPSPGSTRTAAERRPAAAPDERTSQPRRSTRTHLYEFGSFEIERSLARFLVADPDSTDADLIDRVLTEFGITDRSPFALERLADAIVRVRGTARPSTKERQAEQRAARILRLPVRDAGGRTRLYEYGSHEIERVVEELLSVDRDLSGERLLEGVLHVLGIEDRSPLAQQRIEDAAKVARPSASTLQNGSRLRRQAQKRTAATRESARKKAKKAPAKKAPAKKTPAKKTPAKKTPAKKAPAKKAPAKKAPAAERRATKRTAPRSAAGSEVSTNGSRSDPTGPSSRKGGQEAPSRAPQEGRPVREEDTAAPGVKDIADLLGF